MIPENGMGRCQMYTSQDHGIKELYPDKFAHVRMEDELKYFYSTFFKYDLQDDEVYKILNHLPAKSPVAAVKLN
jgi:hypothetical protein